VNSVEKSDVVVASKGDFAMAGNLQLSACHKLLVSSCAEFACLFSPKKNCFHQGKIDARS